MISGYSAYLSAVAEAGVPSASSTSLDEGIFKCPSTNPGGAAATDVLPASSKKKQAEIGYLRIDTITAKNGRDRFSLSRPSYNRTLRQFQLPSAAPVRCCV